MAQPLENFEKRTSEQLKDQLDPKNMFWIYHMLFLGN